VFSRGLLRPPGRFALFADRTADEPRQTSGHGVQRGLFSIAHCRRQCSTRTSS